MGWLLRGGISIGQLLIDDVMVWGETLLKSYYLEDKIANYPRIISDIHYLSVPLFIIFLKAFQKFAIPVCFVL